LLGQDPVRCKLLGQDPVRCKLLGQDPVRCKLLGRDPVRCKFVVDNKCSQRVKNFKYIGREILYENGRIFNKN